MALAAPAMSRGLEAELLDIPGGRFVMGDAEGEADEAPRSVTVAPFRLMRLEVTNRQYADFVAATGHRPELERPGFGYVWTDLWRAVRGADWRHPHGSASDIAGADDHPVVQVSVRDAQAFCAWHGLRLPSEKEWEFAARGTDGRRYPWGDAKPEEKGKRRANFGTVACCAKDAADGYARLAPVGQFPAGASPFGALDMAGNVKGCRTSAVAGRLARTRSAGVGQPSGEETAGRLCSADRLARPMGI